MKAKNSEASIGSNYWFKKVLIILLSLLAVAIMWSPRSTPDYPVLFRFLRIQEKIFWRFQSIPSKQLIFTQNLLARRLAELEHLVLVREDDVLYGASLRYAATAGQLVDIANQIKDRETIIKVKNLFVAHRQSLRKLIDHYPVQDSDGWRYLQDDIN